MSDVGGNLKGPYRVKEAESEIAILTQCMMEIKDQKRKETNDSSPVGSKAFTVIMPPPNVTGNLHMGHAVNLFLQDVLVRDRSANGDDVLWQPGKDHAGIATQLLVTRDLKQRGIDVSALSRQELIDHANEWCEKYGGKIEEQMQRLGILCDWPRSRFTLDDASSKCVLKIFVQLYNAGLIYQDYRLVNWDCELQTAISDLEVESREQQGTLWYIKYPLVSDPKQAIVVATTRPETMFGDTAVAVNPKDKRYKAFIGKQVTVPLTGRNVPVIADDYVKKDFGSGALKITPAHDFNDFTVGQNHNLEQISILNPDGTLNQEIPPAYRGLDWKQARKEVLRDLKAQELLVKEESITHFVPYGDRSNTMIQPRITKQWMMDCKGLAEQAIQAVKDGRIKFLPKKWQKVYMAWLSNIQPWCLSRQLWWGHQIPVWHGADGKVFVAQSQQEAEALAKAHYGTDKVSLVQDEDVLDTWFSSGLWPFSTLDWQAEGDLTAQRYPTDILVTSFDIIFFWVARMVMLSLFATKEVPFKEVYIHALVRDEHGRKMSKSKGNVIDPIELINKYGSDALRLALLVMVIPGQDIRISETHVKGYGHFVHKVWNMDKLIDINACGKYLHTKEIKIEHAGDYLTIPGETSWAACPPLKAGLNIWMLSQYEKYLQNIKKHYDERNFSAIVRESYQFVWNEVCDRYLECAKAYLQPHNLQSYWDSISRVEGESEEKRQARFNKMVTEWNEVRDETVGFMAWLLPRLLILLNPIMPHVTEYIWKNMKLPGMIMTQVWPWEDRLRVSQPPAFHAAKDKTLKDFEDLWHVLHVVRSFKADIGAKPDMIIGMFMNFFSESWPWLKEHRFLLHCIVQFYCVYNTSEAYGVRMNILGYDVVLAPLIMRPTVVAMASDLDAEVAKQERERWLKLEPPLKKKIENQQQALKRLKERLAATDLNKMPLEVRQKLTQDMRDLESTICRLENIYNSLKNYC